MLQSAAFDRWGDPSETGMFGWHRFGLIATRHATFEGVTVPAAGRVGWYHGSDQWDEGEFFRFELTSLHPIGSP